MNNKQRSSNDEPNRNPKPTNEKQLAEHTARMLELQPIQAQSKDDHATAELGSLLRDAAKANQPESNVDLREQLMAELVFGSAVAEVDQVASKEVSPRSTRHRFWIAAAASGLLLVGGAIAYNSSFVGTLSNVALLEEAEQPNIEATGERMVSSPKTQIPEVVFRTETRTRQVPVTRMRTETKTRSVPVTRVRDEIRQVKQADGSFKSETVKVPYTEQVQQSYSFQMPFAENVSQSYQVQVPYTADGKRIDKADYGKYGLDVGGDKSDQPSQGFPGSLDSSFAGQVGPSFHRQNLSGELESAPKGQGFGPAEPPLSASPATTGKGKDGNGIIGQFSADQELREGGGRRQDVASATINSLKDGTAKMNKTLEFEKASRALPLTELKSLNQDQNGLLTLSGSPADVANVKREIDRLTDAAKLAHEQNIRKPELGAKTGVPVVPSSMALLGGNELSARSVGKSGEKNVSGSGTSPGGGHTQSSGQSAGAGMMVFPAADTWREKQVRRQNFKDFRLNGEQVGLPGPAKESSVDEAGLAKSKGEASGSSSRGSLSRPAEFISGGELPGSQVSEVGLTPKLTMFNGQSHLDLGVQKSLREEKPSLAVSPANEIGLYGDEDRRLQGFGGRRAQQIAQETRMVEELELQRDQLTIVKKFGPGHADINALKHAIKKRKAMIEELEKQSERYEFFDSNTSGEQYEPIFENAFIAAKGPATISTFSIDVDTASYANMRRMLNSGRRPPPNSIRLEELVNYFQYDYAQPTGDQPFSVNLELAECPWEAGQQLLRVGLKGKDIHVAERPPTNVVFLIDVSGSMSSNDKLPLLKSGFQMMSRQLGENDRVSIVTYAGNAGVALAPTNGSQTSTINTAIEQLSSGGSTHGSAGIKLAYELAQQSFIQGGVNRVMLATDGDLNVGVTSDDALVSLIKEKAAEGVFLTVLGFGTGNLKDGKLEKLADNGNGMYAYIDSTREAHRVLVDQLSGSLVTIAKDVKIQVEFNPVEVKSYRLLGYENRMLETKDFDDDAKDAGEIGAGHTVTAIYQIEPATAVSPNVSLPAGMKYQVKSEAKQTSAEVDEVDKDGLSKAAWSGELATVALRYKQPAASESERLEVSIKSEAKRFEEASADFRFAASVAGFGMFLRNSEHKGAINAGLLQRIASQAIGKDESGYRSEFIDLIRRASNR